MRNLVKRAIRGAAPPEPGAVLSERNEWTGGVSPWTS
jgi:hypothetical protein